MAQFWAKVTPTYGYKFTQTCDEAVLEDALTFMRASLNFLYRNPERAIVDIALCLRIVLDQLNIIKNKEIWHKLPRSIVLPLHFVQQFAEVVQEEISKNAKANSPDYWKKLGNSTLPDSFHLDYSLRTVNRSLMNPNLLTCKEQMDFFDKPISSSPLLGADYCLSFIHNFRQLYLDKSQCRLPDICLDFLTKKGYKDYALTHQLLTLIHAETNDCLTGIKEYTGHSVQHLRDTFCADVLRDAEMIEKRNFPSYWRDLLMEQIAFCGLYGYVDFLNKHWLNLILSWQSPHGGFPMKKRLVCLDNDEAELIELKKRNEGIFDDGNSAHTTSVGVAAGALTIRLCLDVISVSH